MKNYRWLVPIILLALFLLGGVVLAAAEVLPRSAISGGGSTGLAADGHILHGALGQSVAGAVSNADYHLCSGFWCGEGSGVPTIHWLYLPLVVRNASTQ